MQKGTDHLSSSCPAAAEAGQASPHEGLTASSTLRKGSGESNEDVSGGAGSMESSLPGGEVARLGSDLARVERLVPLRMGARQGWAPRKVHFLAAHAGGALRVWRSDGAAACQKQYKVDF